MKTYIYNKLLKGILGLLLVTLIFSCRKSEFLDKKPISGLVVPSTLEDLQRLLDNDMVFNKTGDLSEISSDNYNFFNKAAWQAVFFNYYRNSYIWKSDLFEGTTKIKDWNTLYTQILYANIVLDGLNKIEINNSNRSQFNFIKGSALFSRSFAFFNLAQIFAPAFDNSTADNDMGIPLRLEPDVTLTSTRANIRQTYNQILSDLVEAADFLPSEVQTINRNRPCKPAALALLARVYMSMRQYDNAYDAAERSLNLYNKLLDYRVTTSFPKTNAEILYYSDLGFSGLFGGTFIQPNIIIDPELYSSYSSQDLRKSLFFIQRNNRINVNRMYDGGIGTSFGGLATDEVYLIKAECQARSGMFNESMVTLNLLLVNRFASGSFTPYKAASKEEAVAIVLQERRKELVFRGLRWQDLRRLNKEGANITLKRNLDGTEYLLEPNSKRYVLPIPPDEISQSNIPQNIR